MMLDGGGSTQLVCQGETLIASDRYIPQALGVVAGDEREAKTLTSTVYEKAITTKPDITTLNLETSISSQRDNRINIMNIFWVAIFMVPIQIVIVAIFYSHRRKHTQ